MKLYAQCGYGPADKLDQALAEGLVDGVILSSRYMRPDKAEEECTRIRKSFPDADVLMDPEYCATAVVGSPNAQLGYLEEWDYFRPPRITAYLVAPSRVEKAVRETLEAQLRVGVTSLIAPSVYVPKGLDSVHMALTLGFMQRAATADVGDQPVLATVALHRDALLNRADLLDFANGITGMDQKPDGIYLLIGADNAGTNEGLSAADLTQPAVLGAWMFLNLVFSINGMFVVNGFSDLLTPFLGAAGGACGATGWWSNLQQFSLDRYVRSPGIRRQPKVRYLSQRLLARVTVDEREAMAALLPETMNGLPHDRDYRAKQPNRTEETCQTWEALRALTEDICVDGDPVAGVENLTDAIADAEKAWARLRGYGISQHAEAVDEHLRCLKEALDVFIELAEL